MLDSIIVFEFRNSTRPLSHTVLNETVNITNLYLIFLGVLFDFFFVTTERYLFHRTLSIPIVFPFFNYLNLVWEHIES